MLASRRNRGRWRLGPARMARGGRVSHDARGGRRKRASIETLEAELEQALTDEGGKKKATRKGASSDDPSSRRNDVSAEDSSNKGSKNVRDKGGEVLHIGIDLGTYQSTVASSTGVRKTIESLVGWPKDIVSRRVVGKSIVFGEDCHKHKLALDLYRPLEWGMLKRGATRVEEAARALVRHLVELAEPDSYQKVYAVVGAPAEASHYQVAAIRDALQGVTEATLIVSEPFAVAYGMAYLNNALIVDIGAGTTDLCLMHGAVPTGDDQMTFNQAGDFIDQQLYQLLQERYPEASFTLHMCRLFKEEFSFVGNAEIAVKVTMPVNGVPTMHDITRPMKRACESFLPYLKEALREMIARFDPEFQEELRQRVVLAGGGSRIRGLGEFTQSVLDELGGGKVTVVEDPYIALAEGALAIAQDTPLDQWDTLKVDR
jgi:rod shape-determining protein MreB and related proteins